MVVDLVGQQAALGELEGPLAAAGFRPYKRLFRMARTLWAATASGAAPDARVVPADPATCEPILDLLLLSFDRRAEQIPMLYELKAAASAGQIRAVWAEGQLAGLLFFETQGLTSTLRYWLIAPQFRARRLGSGLMRHYFSQHPTVRRFLLWVLADNCDAIAKYEHYGYTADGLLDQVFATEMIQP